MATDKQASRIDPVDAQVGGDGDIGGIAQTLASADVEAVLTSDAPTRQRLETLKNMRKQLQARNSADRGGDIDDILAEVNSAISQLERDGADDRTPDVGGYI